MLDVLISVIFSSIILFPRLFSTSMLSVLVQFILFFACDSVLVAINEMIRSQAKQNRVATIKSISLYENVSFKKRQYYIK
jgi:hypothetical protein